MTRALVGHGVSVYCRQLASLTVFSLARLIRKPVHYHRDVALHRLFRNGFYLFAGGAGGVIVLMVGADVSTIEMMPSRGTPELWPVQLFTHLAKSEYVLWSLGIWVLVITAIAPLFRGMQCVLATVVVRVQFLFLAVAVPNLIGEMTKGIVGRGRPFVGGSANSFSYSPLVWTEQFASFPSGHAITAFALAFSVTAVWPRTRYIMVVYALLIACTRVLLLAHHPSDVLAGAMLGLLGAALVRYWFAVRRLGFAIHDDGRIVAVPGSCRANLKGLAVRPFGP